MIKGKKVGDIVFYCQLNLLKTKRNFFEITECEVISFQVVIDSNFRSVENCFVKLPTGELCSISTEFLFKTRKDALKFAEKYVEKEDKMGCVPIEPSPVRKRSASEVKQQFDKHIDSLEKIAKKKDKDQCRCCNRPFFFTSDCTPWGKGEDFEDPAKEVICDWCANNVPGYIVEIALGLREERKSELEGTYTKENYMDHPVLKRKLHGLD